MYLLCKIIDKFPLILWLKQRRNRAVLGTGAVLCVVIHAERSQSKQLFAKESYKIKIPKQN